MFYYPPKQEWNGDLRTLISSKEPIDGWITDWKVSTGITKSEVKEEEKKVIEAEDAEIIPVKAVKKAVKKAKKKATKKKVK